MGLPCICLACTGKHSCRCILPNTVVKGGKKKGAQSVERPWSNKCKDSFLSLQHHLPYRYNAHERKKGS
jgi:hypothetical protein